MSLPRALKYFLGPRFVRDLYSLLSHRLRQPPAVLFFAGSQVDLQWVIPIWEATVARGLHCAFAGPGLKAPAGAEYVDITVHLLRYLRTSILVTATSGLTRERMPHCQRRVAVPHSLVSLHMVYPPATFDPYTDVFCCGIHHQAEVEAMNRQAGRTDRRAVTLGYGKFESLQSTRPAQPHTADGRPHVLIGPSWGPGNILESMGEALVGRLLDAGYRVTLRPHPSFFIYGDALITPLIKRYQSQPGFRLESSVEESRALWTADLMLSDYSGFAMEFAFIRERPVLYVDVPPKVLNPAWQTLGPVPLEISIRDHIGRLAAPRVDDVLEQLAALTEEPDRWADAIRAERTRYWANFGQFGNQAADELVRMVSRPGGGEAPISGN